MAIPVFGKEQYPLRKESGLSYTISDIYKHVPNANRDTILPACVSEIPNPSAISGRIPITVYSLVPRKKLSMIRPTTAGLKNRALDDDMIISPP